MHPALAGTIRMHPAPSVYAGHRPCTFPDVTDDDTGPRFPPGAMHYVYAQIAADLEARIKAGEWGYGDRLPAREQLAAEYGAAVMSVRHAQRELAERGIIAVVAAKGAYVTWAPAGGDSPP
jgi:hypothetical protein